MLENIETTKVKQDNGVMSFLFVTLMITNILLLISIATDIVTVERYMSYAVFAIGIVLFLYSWFINKNFKPSELILFAIGLYLLLIAIFKQWKYDQLVVVGQFVLMLTAWRSSDYIGKSEKINKLIFYTYVLLGGILLALAVSPYAYTAYVAGTEISNELTLGFPNPNQAGIIIISTIIILTIAINNSFVKKKIKVFIWGEIILLGVILLLTNARTCIIALIIYFGFYFTERIPSLRKLNPLYGKNHKLFSTFILFSPLLFLYGYLWLSETPIKNIEFLGKKLFSGRQHLYRDVLSTWNDKLLGDLTVFNFENKHNILLTVMINIGIIGLILYLIYTIYSYFSFFDKCLKNNKLICCAAILVFYIIGYAEASILTGGTIYYVTLLLIMMLANYSERSEAKHDGVEE